MATGIDKHHYKESKMMYLEKINNSPELRNMPVYTTETIEQKIKEITDSPSTTHILEVITRDGKPRLLLKTQKPYKEIVSIEDAFDIVLEAHMQNKHANAWYTYQVLATKYTMPMLCVNLAIDLCYVCNRKSMVMPGCSIDKQVMVTNGIRRGVWRMNIVRDDILTNCDVHCKTKYLLIYKENSTNFVVLRPLFKSAQELSLDIFQLFVEFGYPQKVVVPDNMIVFYEEVFRMVYAINPITEVPLQQLASNHIFEEDKKEVLSEIDNWKKINNNIYWNQGCHMVQYKMNNTIKYITQIESNEKYFGIPFNLFFNKSDANIVTKTCTEENDSIIIID